MPLDELFQRYAMMITFGLQWDTLVIIVGLHVVNLLLFRMKRGIYPAANDEASANKFKNSPVISIQ